MKRNVKSILGFKIGATDGEIGTVKNLLFDDHTWTIRYLVVETGSWLFGRKVLLAPESLLAPDWESEVFPVNLTKDQVKHSPDIDTEQPVTRQEEARLYQHYPWTTYWGGGLWAGGIGTSGMMMPAHETVGQSLEASEAAEKNKPVGDPNLRSTQYVSGYTIRATDDSIGDVEDFIFDDSNWKIDYLVVDTGNWLPGKKVIISPAWIKEIEWETSSVIVNTKAENIKNSPEYDPEKMDDLYEADLHNHYNQILSK